MTRSLLLAALALASALPAAAQPDIVGRLAIQFGRDSGFPGDSVTVPISTGNSGTEPTPAFPAAVYLSTDRFLTSDDTLLARIQIPGIDPQMNGGRNARVRLPDLPRGGYYFIVALDDPDTVAETNEDNNLNTGAFTISPESDGPDLLVSSAENKDPEVDPGGRVSVEYVPVNAGRSDVGDFEVGYYLANQFTRPVDWVELERETIGNLDAGEDDTESEQVTIPANTPPGVYEINIVLDPDNRVAEPDETNNVLGVGVRVLGATTGEDAPGASALALAASPNPAGASVRLTYVLAEAGTVRLVLVDALGREVTAVTGNRGAGPHAEALDTSRLAPGVYVARLTAGAETAAHRVTVAR